MTMRNPESIAGIPPEATEFAALDEAASAVLGYFTHLRYNHYLCLLDHAFVRWRLAGMVADEFTPTARGGERFWFDFSLFDLQKFCYALGVYQHIAISHSVANAYLGSEAGRPRTLYLRGFDFESAVDTGGGMAMGLSTADDFMFNGVMEREIHPHFPVYRGLSPKDVYWGTATSQKFFYGDTPGIYRSVGPMRSFAFNAKTWREDVTDLMDRMDHIVVYVSSDTPSIRWELAQLMRPDRRVRTTVVFDAGAMDGKVAHLRLQDTLAGEAALAHAKTVDAPPQDPGEWRRALARVFFVTTPKAVETDPDWIRRRIRESVANRDLTDVARAAKLPQRHGPALDQTKLDRLARRVARLDSAILGWMDAARPTCLPLFLYWTQHRILLSIILGDNDGLAFALRTFAGAMDGALAGVSGGASPEQDECLRALQSHRDVAGRIAPYVVLLQDVEPQPEDAHIAINEMTTAREAVDRYFATTPVKAQQPETAHGR